MPSSIIARDALACVLAFLPAKEIALASRVAQEWQAASHSRTAWRSSHLHMSRAPDLRNVPTPRRQLVRSLRVASMGSPIGLPLGGFSRVTALHIDQAEDEVGRNLHGFLRPKRAGDAEADSIEDAPLVTLTVGYLDPVPVGALQSVLYHPRLRSLEVLELNASSSAFGVSALENLANLKRLVVRSTNRQLSDTLWLAIQGLKHLHTVEAPDQLSSAGLTPLPPSLTHLSVLPWLDLQTLLAPLRDQLRHLDLSAPMECAYFAWVSLHRTLFEFLSQAPELRYLALRGLEQNQWMTRSLPEAIDPLVCAPRLLLQPTLVKMGMLNTLYEVVLQRAKPESEDPSSELPPSPSPSMALLPSLPLGHLTSLDLSRSYFTADFVKDWSSLHLPHLKHLSVEFIASSDQPSSVWRDAFWTTIARLGHLESLSLDLRFAPVGIAVAFRSLARLRTVQLHDTKGEHEWSIFSGETIDALVRLPLLSSLLIVERERRVPVDWLHRLCIEGSRKQRLRVIDVDGTNGEDLAELASVFPLLTLTHNKRPVRSRTSLPAATRSRCAIM